MATTPILADRVLLDLIEQLGRVRDDVKHADAYELAHRRALIDNALRTVTDYLVQLREERLRSSEPEQSAANGKLVWVGNDEKGYVGRVGVEELYRVDTWTVKAIGRRGLRIPAHRAFAPSWREVLYHHLLLGPGKSSIVNSADEAKAFCETDYAKRRTAGDGGQSS